MRTESNNDKLIAYFDLMYEAYINGNRADHRERFFKMDNIKRINYLLYLFSISGTEYPRILESLK